MKIQLKGREIPRNEGGDPAFKRLGSYVEPRLPTATEPISEAVIGVFSAEEIVELVNRALYQLEYQHNAHKQRGTRERERERAIKLKVKEMYHVSWMKATSEQVEKAREEVERNKG